MAETKSIKPSTIVNSDTGEKTGKDKQYRGTESSVMMLPKHNSDRRYARGKVMKPDAIGKEYFHQVDVELQITFLKINAVDTVNQEFAADIFLQAKWEEVSLYGLDQKQLSAIQMDDLWKPYLVIMNEVRGLENEKNIYVVRMEQGYEVPVVVYQWRFSGVFKEKMGLHYFPFDVQNLSIKVTSERSIDEISFINDRRSISSVNINTFGESNEWSIYKHVESRTEHTTLEYASATIKPIMIFSCRVKRKVGFYIWNVIFIIFLILCLLFATCAVDPCTPYRLTSGILLCFTLVTFKLVIIQSLPKISYLTYLDIYVLSANLFLSTFTTEEAVMSALARTTDKDSVRDYDELAIVCLAVLFFFCHLFFFAQVNKTALRYRRKLEEIDMQYEAKAQIMNSKPQMYSSPGVVRP